MPKTDDTSSEKAGDEMAGVEESKDSVSKDPKAAAETTTDAIKDKKDDAPKESSTESATAE